MYPQLFNQASRLAPLLARIMQRSGQFASPLWKATQIDVPAVHAEPVPPQSSPGVSPPVSTGNLSAPANYSIPSQRAPVPFVGPGMPFGLSGMPPSPPSTVTPTYAPNSAAPRPMTVPVPTPRPAEAPTPTPDMSFFQRNTAMMRDPMSGAFIDPTAAAQAVRGPDLINKMMAYLHNKDIG